MQIGADLTVPGHPEISAIGDATQVPGPDDRPLPGLATVSIQQARHVAKAIRGGAAGASTPFKYLDKGALAVVGRGKAVCEIRGHKLSGRPAFFTYLTVHMYYLSGGGPGHRVKVLIDWISARVGDPQNQVIDGGLADPVDNRRQTRCPESASEADRARGESRADRHDWVVRALDQRLLAYARATRTFLFFSVALGVLSALLIVAQAWLLADVVSRAFLGGRSLAQLQTPLIVLLLVVLARAIGRVGGRAGGESLLRPRQVAAARGIAGARRNARPGQLPRAAHGRARGPRHPGNRRARRLLLAVPAAAVPRRDRAASSWSSWSSGTTGSRRRSSPSRFR